MYLKILATALSAPVAFAALASDTGLSFTPEKISTEIDFGTLSGKAKERVYLPEEKGRKASQLDWKYSNAPIVKGAFNWDLLPRVSVGASGWTTLAGRGGNMVDRDWLDTSNPGTWTDESKHPNTRLNFANEFDLNIKGWLLNQPDYQLGLMAGYQENRYSCTAKGGSYMYSSEGGFRDETG